MPEPSPIKFNEYELKYLHSLLAIKTPLHIIAQQFRVLFEKDIRGEHLLAITERDKDTIKEIARKELSNNGAVPISYSRIRLEYIFRALEDACSPKVIRSYKVSEPYIDANGNESMRDVYKPEYGIDQSAIKGLIDSAQKEQFWADRLVLEKLHKGIDTAPKGGIPTVTAYTGYEEDDEKLLIESHGQTEMDS